MTETSVRVSGSAAWIILLISLVLAIPALLGINTDQQERIRWEKRSLNVWPIWHGWATLPDYFDGINQFANDHIGLVVILNRAYRQLLFYFFFDPPVANLSVGEDGFVFLNSHSPHLPYRVFDRLCQNRAWDDVSKSRLEWMKTISLHFERRGYSMLFAAAPSKPGLYPDYLPDNLPNNYKKACWNYSNQPNSLQAWSAQLLGAGVLLFYPYQEFYLHRLEPDFYPKENFHWDGASTHLFAKTLFQQLGFKHLQAYDVESRRTQSYSDLSMLGFPLKNNVREFDYNGFAVTRLDQQPKLIKQYYQHSTDFSLYKTKNPISDTRALLISNSFGRPVAPHLAPGFSTLLHININNLLPEEYMGLFGGFLEIENIDQIIVLMQDEAFVQNNFFEEMAKAVELIR